MALKRYGRTKIIGLGYRYATSNAIPAIRENVLYIIATQLSNGNFNHLTDASSLDKHLLLRLRRDVKNYRCLFLSMFVENVKACVCEVDLI